MNESIPEKTRRNVFQTLVTTQDQGIPVEESRQQVASHFQLDVEEIRQIEREGISKNWDPL